MRGINERGKRRRKKKREKKGTYKQKAYTQRLISFKDGTVPHVGGRQSVRGRGLSMVVAVGWQWFLLVFIDKLR